MRSQFMLPKIVTLGHLNRLYVCIFMTLELFMFIQTTEEEYFRNKMHSGAMEEFLECIGIKVRLKGFEG